MKAIVLDIEGTTTPIAFVTDVLFPFARAHLRACLLDPARAGAIGEALGRLREERAADAGQGAFPDTPAAGPDEGAAGESSLEAIAIYVEWLMDRDRKSPGLKLLQGLIWEEGYRAGDLRGDVYPDVPRALSRWSAAGVTVAIYSSGSELAQRLLFGSTRDGDLTPLVDRFFDTSVGAKQSPESYRRIAGELQCRPDEVLFVSDVATELDAAAAAGWRTLLCVRPGNRPQPRSSHRVVYSLDDVGT